MANSHSSGPVSSGAPASRAVLPHEGEPLGMRVHSIEVELENHRSITREVLDSLLQRVCSLERELRGDPPKSAATPARSY
jgi:hypothetical protein